MSRTNAELVAEVFSETPVHGDPGEHDTMLGIDKAPPRLGSASTLSTLGATRSEPGSVNARD